jgi:diguanylate cyclase (GGDEF)-like protein
MNLRAPSLKANLFWPLALLSVLVFAGVAAAGLGLLTAFDIAARNREQSVVQNGISGRMGEVAHMATGECMWDQSVRNLDNRFDPAWAQLNIGAYFNQSDGFAASFVMDAADRPIYAARLSDAVDPATFYQRFAGGAGSLVKEVRAAEALRGKKGAPVVSQALADAVQATTLADVGGSLYILTATLVQPDFGTVRPKGPRAPIVITAMAMDQAFLNSFADRFLLRNVRIHVGSGDVAQASGAPGAAHIALKNHRGVDIATLEWTPQMPGQVLLRQLGLPVLGILACLAAGVLFLYHRGQKIAEVLMTSEARATHMAYHDALTGLPNRLLFFDRLGHALHQMRRTDETIAVLLIDLDRFKDVNDTFGHPAGDDLIRQVGKRLAAQCRLPDTFARLSGDEFAIIQTGTSVSAAASLATRLAEAMTQPIELEAGRVFIGCSIGITIIQDAGIDPAEALRQADLALYRAKDTAKGQFCFFEIEMDLVIKARRSLESDLRDALAQGALHMCYQPQVNERGGMVGVEALVRWRHPERGEIGPSFFVPVAEESGLILDLGMFTLRRAFEDSKRWKHLRVAVNVSAKQLRMRDFAARVMALVHEIGVDPGRFELEITEGILLGDDPDTHDMLNRLRSAGFSLVLDDFGTGYSSLSYLQRYPINKIKIDQSFIANLGVEAESEAVIGAIVKLAKALRLSVIAEGVETAEQVARLNATGCFDMQGYLFGRPVGAEQIDESVSSVSALKK